MMEGLNIAFTGDGTNRNISTIQNQIKGVGVSSLFLDSMGSRLQPLAMKHHISS